MDYSRFFEINIMPHLQILMHFDSYFYTFQNCEINGSFYILLQQILQEMLFKSYKMKSGQPTFSQQLSNLKDKSKIATSMSENSQYYKTMISILDLLLDKYPLMSTEILILKQSLKKWYQHLSQEHNNKNREILKMKDDAVINVSREIGTVLQEIGYYVKYLTQRYEDQDIKKFYAKYLRAIKKLQWNQAQNLKDVEIQTEMEEIVMFSNQSFPTLKSIKLIHNPHSKSDLTNDSLPGSFKTIEQERYVKVKQENLELQRKMDRIQSKLNELQNQNRQLKAQIDRLFMQNQQLNASKDKSLHQINKLKEVLQDLKLKEDQTNKYQETKRMHFQSAENKYQHFNQIRNALHRTLDHAQEQIKNEQVKQMSEPEQYLNNNFTVDIDDKYKTIKKGNIFEQSDSNSQLRMMLLQAIAIQSFLNDPSILHQ